MTSVLFLDPVAPFAYGGTGRAGRALGGTEATLLRVAETQAPQGVRVAVAQSRRSDLEVSEQGILFRPYDPKAAPLADWQDCENVVLLRADKLMKRLARQYPRARKWLWMHCFPGRHRRGLLAAAARHDFTLLAVSHALREAVLRDNSEDAGEHGARVEVVYNPVVVEPSSPTGPRDRNKLVFFSSPHKGLEQVLERFAQLRAGWPELSLYLANPGYIPSPEVAVEGVVNLGALDHGEVLRHVAEAFCVFYPQSSFAETFGLVFAEANALGTPVIAHPLGAAEEVLGPEQVVDCESERAVEELFRRWRDDGPPSVGPSSRFTLASVTQQWLGLLKGK